MGKNAKGRRLHWQSLAAFLGATAIAYLLNSYGYPTYRTDRGFPLGNGQVSRWKGSEARVTVQVTDWAFGWPFTYGLRREARRELASGSRNLLHVAPSRWAFAGPLEDFEFHNFLLNFGVSVAIALLASGAVEFLCRRGDWKARAPQ